VKYRTWGDDADVQADVVTGRTTPPPVSRAARCLADDKIMALRCAMKAKTTRDVEADAILLMLVPQRHRRAGGGVSNENDEISSTA
jgi:hypothetical protein